MSQPLITNGITTMTRAASAIQVIDDALKLVNKSTAARKMSVSITGVDNAELKVVGLESEEMMRFIVPVAAHGVDRYRVLVVVPAASDISTINFVISDLDTGEEITNRVPFQSGER